MKGQTFVFSKEVVVFIPRTRDWTTWVVPKLTEKAKLTKKEQDREALLEARRIFKEKLENLRYG